MELFLVDFLIKLVFINIFFRLECCWLKRTNSEEIQFGVSRERERSEGRNTTTFTFCSTVISNVLKYVKPIQTRKQNSTKPNGDLSNIYLDLEEGNPQEKLANEFVKNLSAEN